VAEALSDVCARGGGGGDSLLVNMKGFGGLAGENFGMCNVRDKLWRVGPRSIACILSEERPPFCRFRTVEGARLTC
jgi:hypothetical protein